MSFVLRMLRRELRGSWARLGVFFLSVGIGVAAIVSLRSLVGTVRVTLTREARVLVGADVVVQAQRPISGDIRARVDRLAAAAGVTGRTEVVETQTMASAPEGAGNGRVRLVEIRGIEAPFPYYGAIELEGGRAYTHDLVAHHGALVQPELLTALGVEAGSSIRLAGQTFTIRGVVLRDRVQRGGIAFGPRVYVDLADLRATSLLGFGSRATYQILFRVPDSNVGSLTTGLRDELRQETVGVRSWQTMEDRLGENLTLAENYLSLVGFAIVVLGGLGVWSVARVIVRQKVVSVAMLKCLGASAGSIVTIYVLEVLALAGVGSGVGVALAAIALHFVPPSVLEPLGVSAVHVTASAVAQGVIVGVLVSLTFSLVPLLEMRHVKPLRLLRQDASGSTRRRDGVTWAASISTAAGLAAIAMWQAQSAQAGLFVAGGLAVVAAVLAVAGRALVGAIRPLLTSRVFAIRHAAISLGRPGGQARVVLMTVGLGCFFVLGVRAIEGNLLHELGGQVGAHSPDLVLIDIQDDQVDAVRAAVAPYLREPARVMPLMRGRLVSIQGRSRTRSLADIREDGRLSREFGLTYRDGLEPNERIVSGAFWSGPSAPPVAGTKEVTEVSVEKNAAEDGGLAMGDVVTFDIGGRRLDARVTSIRTVAWDNAENGGFVFVLRPSRAVQLAAHSFVGFLQVRDDRQATASVQRALVEGFPNVSAIDVRDVLASIRSVLDNVTTAITAVGAVMLAGGVLILVGAVSMTRFERVYDAAIYRTLGASARRVAAMVAVEYGVLGCLAGVLGAAGALALSWTLARYLFHIEWQPAPLTLAAGVAGTTLLVGLVGFLASADVLFRKPLGVLRH